MILRLLLILSLGACSGPGYYLQAMSGQRQLMQSRQDIQALLNDPATSADLVRQLHSAEQIKAFAQDSLHLPLDGSYSSYVEVEGEALVWNVVATREFSLQPKKWCFPVAGCVPYRGFFNEQKARDSANRLAGRGMDVLVAPATAYSSLGWFNDPLLSTMLGGSDTRLAGYLFHELAHQRLYIKDDGAFNEGYASFVEEAGTRAWLQHGQRQDELQHWRELKDVSRDFSSLVGKTRTRLAELYESKAADTVKRQRKTEIFHALEQDWKQLANEKWQGKAYYSAWFSEPPNNARLALYNTYEGSYCAFQGLWDAASGDWSQFHQLAEQKSRLPKDQRRKWLMQTCADIAPQANL